MNRPNNFNVSASSSLVFPMILLFVGLIGIYYLYHYLFDSKTDTSYPLLKGKQTAKVDPSNPITVTSNQLPRLSDGGEYTVSMWFYINDWSYHSGLNKSILTVGGPAFDTVRIYLGGVQPKLYVRFHTRETSPPALGAGVPVSGSITQTPTQTESLDKGTRDVLFTTPQTNSGLLEGSGVCDLPSIELQRWVNLVVAVNGRTVDVYVDGKLSRSCVLPALAKVDPAGYSAYLLSYGGFGGNIANVTMYDSALNPERVYKNYMMGPEPSPTFMDWLSSFFSPTPLPSK